MAAHQPMTQTLNVTAARQQWSQLLDRVFRREARVIVEKSGIPVAAIISAQDLEQFQRIEQERQRDLAILRTSQEGFMDVPAEEVERQVAKALAEVHEERAKAKRTSAASA